MEGFVGDEDLDDLVVTSSRIFSGGLEGKKVSNVFADTSGRWDTFFFFSLSLSLYIVYRARIRVLYVVLYVYI